MLNSLYRSPPLKSFKEKIDKFGELWSVVILLIVALPTVEAVVCRSIFRSPTSWSQELTTIIFGVFFIMGGAYCESKNSHVAMDLFYDKFHGLLKIIIDTVIFIACMICCGVLIYFGIKMAIQVTVTLEKSDSLWEPYLFPSRWSIPIGVLLLLFRSFISYKEKIDQSIKYIGENKNK